MAKVSRCPAADRGAVRATYALFVALLPATATVIGAIELRQIPSLVDITGVALVIVGVALHRSGE